MFFVFLFIYIFIKKTKSITECVAVNTNSGPTSPANSISSFTSDVSSTYFFAYSSDGANKPCPDEPFGYSTNYCISMRTDQQSYRYFNSFSNAFNIRVSFDYTIEAYSSPDFTRLYFNCDGSWDLIKTMSLSTDNNLVKNSVNILLPTMCNNKNSIGILFYQSTDIDSVTEYFNFNNLCLTGSTLSPTQVPTKSTKIPTILTKVPTKITNIPTVNTVIPTKLTNIPTISTNIPTKITNNPTNNPALAPSINPTLNTKYPTIIPTLMPSNIPTDNPTKIPTNYPTIKTTSVTVNNGNPSEAGFLANLGTNEALIIVVILGGLLCCSLLCFLVIYCHCRTKGMQKEIQELNTLRIQSQSMNTMNNMQYHSNINNTDLNIDELQKQQEIGRQMFIQASNALKSQKNIDNNQIIGENNGFAEGINEQTTNIIDNNASNEEYNIPNQPKINVENDIDIVGDTPYADIDNDNDNNDSMSDDDDDENDVNTKGMDAGNIVNNNVPVYNINPNDIPPPPPEINNNNNNDNDNNRYLDYGGDFVDEYGAQYADEQPYYQPNDPGY